MMNKKVLEYIGTGLFGFWCFVMGMQLTYLILDFNLFNILLYVAEIVICVLLIKLLDLKTIIWKHEKGEK